MGESQTDEKEEKITTKPLAGGYSSNSPNTMGGNSVSSKLSEQFVSFDFMVTLSKNILESDDNLKNAISQSVDCEIGQIAELKITEMNDGTNKSLCRVNGKIFTDDWELPMLQEKFQKIISDRVLSGHLQNYCSLEDRPNIRRFFCKSSQEILEKNRRSNLTLEKHQRVESNSASTSALGGNAGGNSSISALEMKETPNRITSTSPIEEERVPSQSDKSDGCCIVM